MQIGLFLETPINPVKVCSLLPLSTQNSLFLLLPTWIQERLSRGALDLAAVRLLSSYRQPGPVLLAVAAVFCEVGANRAQLNVTGRVELKRRFRGKRDGRRKKRWNVKKGGLARQRGLSSTRREVECGCSFWLARRVRKVNLANIRASMAHEHSWKENGEQKEIKENKLESSIKGCFN